MGAQVLDIDLQLWNAAKDGQLKLCSDLIRAGADPNACNDGDTALIIAIRQRHAEVRDFLIIKGADVNRTPGSRFTPLMVAAGLGDVQGCRALLANGAQIDATGATHEQALGYAAAHGHVEACRLLLNCRADIDHSDMYGTTAVGDAIVSGHDAVFDFLIERGAAVEIGQVTAAAFHGRARMLDCLLARAGERQEAFLDEAMRQLVAGGQVGLYGAMMASRACPFPDADDLANAARNGHVSMCELLIEYGVSVDAIGDRGSSALHVAVQAGHVDVARLLLVNGADVNLESNKEGWSPLYSAIQSARDNRVEICRLLAQSGAEVRPLCTEPNQMTPFQFAITSGSPAVVRWFVEECGEDLSQLTVDGKTIDSLAGARPEIVEVLRALRSLAAERAIGDGLSSADEVTAPSRRSSLACAL
jgi:ankyrin